MLAKFKFLRGTAFDPFGYTAERRIERPLVRDYEALLDEMFVKLTPENHHLAVGLAAIPEKIRGFGHVKLRHLKAAKADESGAARAIPRGSDAAAQGRRVGARAEVSGGSAVRAMKLYAETRAT